MKTVNGNDEEASYSEYYDDDIPPHYWEGEDANEIIFYDKE